jgi:hypothetical protein
MIKLILLVLSVLSSPVLAATNSFPPKYDPPKEKEVWQKFTDSDWRKVIQNDGVVYVAYVSIRERQIWFTTRLTKCTSPGQISVFSWLKDEVRGASRNCAGIENWAEIVRPPLREFFTPLPKAVDDFLKRQQREYVDSVVPNHRV